MKLTQKLSFRLGIRTLAVIFVLGSFLALMQTTFDFKERQKNVNQDILDMMHSLNLPMSNALWMLDQEHAQHIVDGIGLFDYFDTVIVVDENSAVFAEFKRAHLGNEESNHIGFYSSLLSAFYEHKTTYGIDLFHPQAADANVYGRLIYTIDNHVALTPEYKRAKRTFFVALAGYLLITCCLTMMFHTTIASPLIKLANNFKSLKSRSIHQQNIPHLANHEQSEFSLIVTSANELLENISKKQDLIQEHSATLSLILDATPAMIFAVNNQFEIIFANESSSQFYCSENVTIKGKKMDEILTKANSKLANVIKDFSIHKNVKHKSTVYLKPLNEATIKTFELSLIKFDTVNGEYVLASAVDITEKVKSEEKLEFLAFNDSLSMLPNRNRVCQMLEQISAEQTEYYGVAALADIDKFKSINDSLTYAVGDQLIILLANCLKQEFSNINMLARIGADEFCCIKLNVSRDLQSAKEAALAFAEHILNTIETSNIKIENKHISVSASVGVVVFKQHMVNVDTVLQNIDTAMYHSKKNGRAKATLFEEEMAQREKRLLQLESDINKALVLKEFFFVLQAIVHSKDGRLHSAEALIRWQKGDSVVSPIAFIPFLEDSGLIIEVGYMLLDKLCGYIVDLEKRVQLADDFRISLNVSAKQIAHEDFAKNVIKALKKHGLSGRRLDMEITESATIFNLQKTIKTINRLKTVGITFSLDDFGTGYSSMSYLKDLPVDKLKIDKSFIRDIDKCPQEQKLVRSMINLSEGLGLINVIEGVETEQELNWLNNQKNMLIQGYYFSKPLAPADFEKKYLL